MLNNRILGIRRPKVHATMLCHAFLSVRSLEPSEHFILHIASPFLQGPHGCPAQALRTALDLHLPPAQQFPRAGSMRACGSRHWGTAFLFVGIQQYVSAMDAWKAVLECWCIRATKKSAWVWRVLFDALQYYRPTRKPRIKKVKPWQDFCIELRLFQDNV